MIRGFYTAASGMVSQGKKLNSIANNIANVRTVGYKRDDLIMGTFGEHVSLRMNAYQKAGTRDIGSSVYMQIVDSAYTNFEQGGFEATTRPLDMSILGDGFFVIATEEGEELLTRDGQFSLDEEGCLVLPGFGRVQGENGDLALGISDISVDRFGNIYRNDPDGDEPELVDKLQVVIPEDYATLQYLENSLYTAESFAPVDVETAVAEGLEYPVVRQFNLERSNVDIREEMTDMLASQRSLQSCSQLVKMYDEMANQIATQVSKI